MPTEEVTRLDGIEDIDLLMPGDKVEVPTPVSSVVMSVGSITTEELVLLRLTAGQVIGSTRVPRESLDTDSKGRIVYGREAVCEHIPIGHPRYTAYFALISGRIH